MELRRRIRDLTFRGDHWVVSLVAAESTDQLWRGRLMFFLDGPAGTPAVSDALTFEALGFDDLASQASALSLNELEKRLERALVGSSP